jgi:hypothetical protein
LNSLWRRMECVWSSLGKDKIVRQIIRHIASHDKLFASKRSS